MCIRDRSQPTRRRRQQVVLQLNIKAICAENLVIVVGGFLRLLPLPGCEATRNLALLAARQADQMSRVFSQMLLQQHRLWCARGGAARVARPMMDSVATRRRTAHGPRECVTPDGFDGPARPRRSGGSMSTVFDALRLSTVSLDVAAAQRGTPQEIARRQQIRLGALLEATLQGSRLYRSLWPAGTTPATVLEQLPVVTRAQLMANFDDWVTDPQLQLDALRAFTADPARIAEPWLGRYMVWESSGTSGQPGIFVQDAQAMAVYLSLIHICRCRRTTLCRSRWAPAH